MEWFMLAIIALLWQIAYGKKKEEKPKPKEQIEEILDFEDLR
jgi:hypothetical protein